VPQVQAAEALELLSEQGEATALVDVRPEPEYAERHISGAVSLPLAEIRKMEAASDLPAVLRGKTLLLVCDSAVLSSQAARTGQLGVDGISARGW
jgi:rhodanese-related sulfurtransferase